MNMTYWNEKDGRLSFGTQLKINFSLQNNGNKKMLGKNPDLYLFFEEHFGL